MRIKQIFLFFLDYNSLWLIAVYFALRPGANVYAGFELKGSSARIQAMGQAYVGLANTPDAIFVNCSGLAQLNGASFSVFYTRPFGMKELNYGSLAAIVPTAIGNFATAVISFGNEIYHEQSFIFSISRSTNQNFYYGFNLHYMKLQIAGYGSDFCYGVDLGFLFKIAPKLSWGFFATNLNRASMGKISENLPQTFCTGISLLPIDNLILNLDLFKDSIFPIDFRCGIEYVLFQRIAFRSGFSTAPAQFCAGFGFLFSHFEVDYSVTTHQSLGSTHHLSLQLQLKTRKPVAIHHKSDFEPKSQAITKINLNTADQKQLEKLPGIGVALAKRIIEYRNQIGKFNSLEDLRQVKGISNAKLQQLKPYIEL